MSRSILLDSGIKGISTNKQGGKDSSTVSEQDIQSVRDQLRGEMEKKLQQALADAKQNQQQLWDGLETQFQKYQDSIEQIIKNQLIDLSIRIAEIILQKALPDQDMTRKIIQQSLEPLSDLQGVKVHLSPDDAAFIKEIQQNRSADDITSSIEVVSDNSLNTGDVFIESKNGFFDARITERLQLLKDNLNKKQKKNTGKEK
jgi:flagellar biosynthesis/type III secretory pathway protein FliH